MNVFSDQEYTQVIRDLFSRERSDCESLALLIDRAFRKQVRRFCCLQPELAGRGYEEDILQEIKLRVVTSCISGFFLKQGVGGGINDDPEEFSRWICTVAKNVELDFLRKIRRIRDRSFAPGPEIPAPAEDPWECEDRQALLKNAFAVVMDSGSMPYIVLTWVADSLFIYHLGMESFHAPREIESAFEHRTLFEMRDCLLRMAGQIPWLVLSQAQTRKLDAALSKKYDGRRTYGEVTYREFFMRSGGKSSISIWVNRINNIVRRELGQ